MAKPQAPVGATKNPHPDADHRRRLEALRDRLESAVAEAAHRDLAPLASRYQAVLADLAALPAVVEVDGVDDLAAVRSRRRSGTKAS